MAKKVVLGFSGGVDSFYAAHLLKEKGFKVIPVFFRLTEESDETKAKESAKGLGLPLTVVDLREEFREKVIKSFVQYYGRGLTPNPCAVCNREIKLKYLYLIKEELKADLIATGHYAKVKVHPRLGRRCVFRGVEKGKEQSYFLSLVEREVVEKLVLPLGELTKGEVVKRAAELGYAFEGESQDICFVKGSYEEFLLKFLKPKEGPFKLKSGEVVGRHKGLFFYTVGQRRGLGISYKHPLFVLELRPEENAVIVGKKEELQTDAFFVKEPNWQVLPEELHTKLQAQVRYRAEPKEISSLEYFKNGIYRVKLAAKVNAPAPGQVCAFYSGDLLLGGGEITKVRR